MDYETIIDGETWAFIRRTGEFYPPDTTAMPIAEQRRIYNAMCREFFQGYPEGVSAEDREADRVPTRVYSSGNPTVTVVYFHGGGFVVGGLESHDDICAEICARTGFRVVSADYRLAPEHTHPAQFQDAWAATCWAARTWSGPLVLAGDSAGGNLAAAVAHHARDRLDRIVGQVLIYPALGGDRDKGSYLAHAQAPMLSRDDILFYDGIRHDGTAPNRDPAFAPLADSDFTSLPPTVIVTAQCDPLSDDGRDYRDQIVSAGGKAVWTEEPGLVHGYLRARTTVGRARESFTRIVEAITALGGRAWPW